MKKALILALALALALSLAACGGNQPSSPSDSESPVTSPTQTVSDETTEPTASVTNPGSEYPFAAPIIPDNLSSAPDSFQVALDGAILTLPALYSDFAALGWTCDAIADEALKPGFVMVGNANLKKGDTSLSGAFFINLGDEELPLSECYVYGFAFPYDSKGSVNTSFVLPGGLHIGSTIDEIIAAYGEPTETDDSRSTVTKLIYRFSDNNYIAFEIDKKQPPYWNRITIYREDA